MLNCKTIIVALFSLLLAACNISLWSDESRAGFNVIVITIDALRADHMSCYGYKRDTTPNISKLAERSIVFENAISQSSWTKASMASFFTSLYPHNHKTRTKNEILPDKILTMAEAFKTNGYYTFAIQTNGFINSYFKMNQGFDEYNFNLDLPAQQIVDHFNKFLESQPDRKFFAYLHFMDNHVPYKAPEKYNLNFVDPEYQGVLDKNKFDKFREVGNGSLKLSTIEKQHVVNLYDAAVSYVDDNIQRLLDKLQQLDLTDNTIIIIMSDHGEEFWDHRGYEHGHTMYNELLHVPLIITDPKAPGHKTIKQLVRLIDVFPTLSELFGLQIQPAFMGQELTEIMYAEKEKDMELLAFSEAVLYGPEKKAIQSKHFKLIQRTKNNSFEFYNIDRDPKETRSLVKADISDDHIAVNYSLFQNYFKKYINIQSSQYESEQVALDKETINQLKSLGYLR